MQYTPDATYVDRDGREYPARIVGYLEDAGGRRLWKLPEKAEGGTVKEGEREYLALHITQEGEPLEKPRVVPVVDLLVRVNDDAKHRERWNYLRNVARKQDVVQISRHRPKPYYIEGWKERPRR